jgi:hypothetical protein
MRYVFFETPAFTRLLPSHLDDAEYGRLQRALLSAPYRGDLIPDTGGFRKLRWVDARRQKGKRGGFRVIHYVLDAAEQIWLFTNDGKGEVEDLSAKQCRVLRIAIHEELRARRGSA